MGACPGEKKSKKYEGNAWNTVQEPINEDWTGSLVPVRGTHKGDVEYTSVAVVLFTVFLYSSSTTVAEDHYWPLVGLPPKIVTAIFFFLQIDLIVSYNVV